MSRQVRGVLGQTDSLPYVRQTDSLPYGEKTDSLPYEGMDSVL